MKLKEIQQKFHKELDTIYRIEEVDSFFFLLTESYFDFSRIQLTLQLDFEIDKRQEEQILKALQALKNNVPIQYIIGETEFYSLPFKVNNSVLIPRPETEELVDWIISEFRIQNSEFRILDIGTGSGCIAIALAKNLSNANVYALDISAEALKVAKENAKLNNVKVNFVQADILKWNNEFNDLKFDAIVSNPPYVRYLEKEKMSANVLKHEPHLALFVDDSDSLLFYREIMHLANKILKQKGKLFFEINEYLGKEMVNLLNNEGFIEVTLKTDIFGKDRMIKGVKS